MIISSRALVEMILLGPMNDRRQLQNSPILGDVWIAYTTDPTAQFDLLITPYKERPAGPVALEITRRIEELGFDRGEGQEPHISYLQGIVAARLFFHEVLQVILPMTKWWRDREVQIRSQANSTTIETIIKLVKADDKDTQAKFADDLSEFSELDRYLALAGIILHAGSQKDDQKDKEISPISVVDSIIKLEGAGAVVENLNQLLSKIQKADKSQVEPLIFQVSLNRKVMLALEKSVPTVKGDAARSLFNVRCDNISWAVIDSGIDGTHEAFKDSQGQSRIIKAYDFSNIRKIVSLDNLKTGTPGFKKRVAELREGRQEDLTEEKTAALLKELARDAVNDRPINWELVEEFIKSNPNDPKTRPQSGHGTHVAGIIGARANQDFPVDGMCPDIQLYDLRVLSKTVEDTEFAIIAALQFVRYLNGRHSYTTIHGVNLSLSIPHDVRNYACGRTPICNECERLVDSGVVVVAAAGNLGYQRFETVEGSFESYAAFSITDPGNADSVITVGATHRYRPHTYGVSFFSSRGPTGDGRWKPDLVAPGERIRSALPNDEWNELDGTSMAAPHVSGAAAMLMARYSELIGEPHRIKSILCESATDLGRDHNFQGHGMLDVLRAFQSV